MLQIRSRIRKIIKVCLYYVYAKKESVWTISLDVYCCICFEVTNDVLLKHEINGTIESCFYYDNCGFRKEQGDPVKNLD